MEKTALKYGACSVCGKSLKKNEDTYRFYGDVLCWMCHWWVRLRVEGW